MVPSRRTLLRSSSVLLCTAVAGCVEAIPGVCGSMNRIRLWAEPISEPVTENRAVRNLSVENLTTAERDVVRKAIESEAYTDCIGSESDGIKRLRERIYQGPPSNTDGRYRVYLIDNGSVYSIGFTDGDHTVVVPEETVDDEN